MTSPETIHPPPFDPEFGSLSETLSGHPFNSCEASGCTTSSTRGGLASSLYFLSCQLFTTPPRLENSTRYKLFSTTTVRSCESLFTAADATADGATLVAAGAPPGAVTLGVVLEGGCPATAGADAVGLLVCGVGAFGAKNFAHAMITTIDNNEATKMRSSGRRPLFFCGSLTNVSRP